MRWYTKEEDAYLREIVYGRSHQEIADMMNAKFNTDHFTKDLIKTAIGNRKLNTGRTGRFEKGHVPANKGTKGLTGANKTSFKKGNIPPTQVPVGTETKRADGYIWVKVAEPKFWKQKHRILWEEVHGPIPKAHMLIFIDGDTEHIALDNLKLISRAEMVRLNQMGLAGQGPEMTEAALNLAKLRSKTAEAKRRKKGTK